MLTFDCKLWPLIADFGDFDFDHIFLLDYLLDIVWLVLLDSQRIDLDSWLVNWIIVLSFFNILGQSNKKNILKGFWPFWGFSLNFD